MNQQEIDAILGALDGLDIEPPWDHTVDLRQLSLEQAIADVLSARSTEDDCE
jgi:hypothetical protein